MGVKIALIQKERSLGEQNVDIPRCGPTGVNTPHVYLPLLHLLENSLTFLVTQ